MYIPRSCQDVLNCFNEWQKERTMNNDRDLRSNITFVWFGWYTKYKEETQSFQKQLNTRLISSVLATADITFRLFDFSHKIFS